MSDEEKFKRSETGQSANDLHQLGGSMSARGEGSEREDLENAIEALNNFDDSNNSDIEPVETAPEEPKNDAMLDIDSVLENEAPVEEKTEAAPAQDAQPEPEVAPAPEEQLNNNWKIEKDNQIDMDNTNTTPNTNAFAAAPKAKKSGGAGWKVATFVFLALAILGCGFAAFLVFSDGKTQFMNRTISSYATEKAPVNCSAPGAPASGSDVSQTYKGQRVIVLDGYNLALKIPDTLENLSFEYHRFNEPFENSTFEYVWSTLSINASTVKEGAQSAPSFIGQDSTGRIISLGSITIGKIRDEYLDDNNLGDPVMTADESGRKIYVGMPQAAVSTDIEWENETVTAIHEWLSNPDNYIKL